MNCGITFNQIHSYSTCIRRLVKLSQIIFIQWFQRVHSHDQKYLFIKNRWDVFYNPKQYYLHLPTKPVSYWILWNLYMVTFLLKLFFSPTIKLHVIFLKVDALMVNLNQQNEHVACKIIHKHRNMNSSKSFLH